MPQSIWVLYAVAVTGLLSLLTFAILLWRHYVYQLPWRYRQNISHVTMSLDSVSGSELTNVKTISEAFRKASFLPLESLWTTCVRSFRELGDGRVFVDIDEVFDAEKVMRIPLKRQMAQQMQPMVLLLGLFWSLATIAAGMFTLGTNTNGLLLALGLAIALIASAVLASFILRSLDLQSWVNTIQSFNHLVQRIKECLPPAGRDDLIHTLYILQQNQSRQASKNIKEMEETLINFVSDTFARQMEARFREAIQKHFTPSIQKMADTHEFVLKEMQADQKKRLESVFQLFVDQVGEKLNNQLGGMVHQVRLASDGMLQITESLQSVTGMVERDLDLNKQMQTSNQETLQEISTLHKTLMDHMMHLTEQLGTLTESTQTLSDTSMDVNRMTLEMAEKSGAVYTEMNEKLQSLYNQMDTNLGNMTGTLDTNLVKLSTNLNDNMGLLTEVLDSKISGLAHDTRESVVLLTDTVSKGMEENGHSMDALKQTLEASIHTMDATYQDGTVKITETLAAKWSEMFEAMTAETTKMQQTAVDAVEQTRQMGVTLSERYQQETSALLDKVKGLNLALNDDVKNGSLEVLREIQKQGKETASMFDRNTAAVSSAAEAQIKALKDESSGLLNVLPQQMKEAFEQFSTTMSATLQQSMADSKELLEQLEQKTKNLHAEYEVYFTRTEGNTEKMLGDLRFAMESVMEQFATMSKENLEHNQDFSRQASDDFRSQVARLMSAVEEQTQTITLYVKDLGIDLNALNANFKDSVKEFAGSLDNTVSITFEEFDKGLSEVVQRIASLTAHIEESVDALPETVSRLGGKG